jgi:hypothetical protein
MFKNVLTVLFVLTLLSANGQDRVWKDTTSNTLSPEDLPIKDGTQFRVTKWNIARLRQRIDSVTSGTADHFIIDLPMPDGTSQKVVFFRSTAIPKTLQKKYGSSSFTGNGVSNSNIRAALDFKATEIQVSVTFDYTIFLITPMQKDTSEYYISYRKDDLDRNKTIKPTKKY